MPDTPIYGLPFEQTPTDQPGITLHGGLSGTEEILAEAVETELERIDGDVDDLQTEVARGWKDIVAGDVISAATTFDLTAGGTYPAGTFDLIRVYLRGALTGEGRVTMRVNDDSTPDLHRQAWTAYRLDTGAVAGSNSSDTTVWAIAQWSTSPINVAEATIFNTHEEVRLSYEGSGMRTSFDLTLRQRTLSGGFLESNRLINSLRIGASSGVDPDLVAVWIEGHVAAS